jgi:hypothetical protein
MQNVVIIGLAASRPGSGKTTVAMELMNRAGFIRLPLADPLKRIGTAILTEAGISDLDARRYLYHDRKAVIPGIGVTGRHLLQTLGTDWGRKLISRRLWLNLWRRSLEEISRAAVSRNVVAFVVVDDVRFPDEADMIRRLGGRMWMIERPLSKQQARRELLHRLSPGRILRAPWLLLMPWKLFAPQHASEGGLNRYQHFDARIRNDGTIHELLQQTWKHASRQGIQPSGIGRFEAIPADAIAVHLGSGSTEWVRHHVTPKSPEEPA